jgi:hypothetical protein
MCSITIFKFLNFLESGLRIVSMKTFSPVRVRISVGVRGYVRVKATLVEGWKIGLGLDF